MLTVRRLVSSSVKRLNASKSSVRTVSAITAQRSVSTLTRHKPAGRISTPSSLKSVNVLLARQQVTLSIKRLLATKPDVPYTLLDLPALSPTMAEGNLSSWKKKEGDQVRTGDMIAEIETDKATVAYEATEEGYLAKILVPDGTKKLKVGSPIAVLVTKAEDVSKFKDFTLEAASAGSAAPAPAASTPAPSKTESVPAPRTTVPHTELELPALSPTMAEGNLSSWTKQVGDFIKSGDMIAEIETDKATVAYEATEEGYLAKILVPAGTKKIKVGTPIALVVSDKALIAQLQDYTPGTKSDTTAAAATSASAAPTTAATPVAAPQQTQQAPSGGRVFASPLARKIASEMNVDLTQLRGTGPNQRVVRQDVLEYAQSAPRTAPQPQQQQQQARAAPVPSSGANYTDVPASQIRKLTAARLTMSKQTIPHYYLTMDCRVDELLKVRADLNTKAKDGEYKLSVNDFIIKAAALALKKVPEANSEWRGEEEVIRRYNTVDINVAVNTDRGLFTPLIRDADLKGLATIANSVKDLAKKAQDNKLSLDELQIGTFTISNLGMFGIKQFAAVINPPQACILAVGGTEKRVIVNESAKEEKDKFAVANYMSVTLSCDHRVVDGAIGARWLQAFKDIVENPLKLML